MGMLAERVSEVTAGGGLSGDARRIRAEQWFAEVLVGSVSVLAVLMSKENAAKWLEGGDPPLSENVKKMCCVKHPKPSYTYSRSRTS